MDNQITDPKIEQTDEEDVYQFRLSKTKLWKFLTVIAFFVGIGSGYLAWGRDIPQEIPGSLNGETASGTDVSSKQIAEISLKINPPEGYPLPFTYGDIGPKMLEAGAIDFDKFVQVYQQAGAALTEDQLEILTQGSDEAIIINKENAYFLLNFFWAFGLTNQNELLTEGPIANYGNVEIGGFASTGGWTLSAEPLEEIYSNTPIVNLTPEQQEKVVQVASGVFRPCCNNPTHFPDCNHGMAMLGLLELMASQDASINEMFEAAKYFNAFWFPQQSFEIALYFQERENLSFAEINAQRMLSADFSSASGFQNVHKWLQNNGFLQQTQGDGSSCGV